MDKSNTYPLLEKLKRLLTQLHPSPMLNSLSRRPKHRGFTLVEVAIGMAVFVLLLLSGSAAITQTQKLAHSNVMHNTARTVVEGYMEQMRGLSFAEYRHAMADTVNVPFATKGISSLKTGADISYDDPLYIGIENKKEVVLDLIKDSAGNTTAMTMDMYINPTLTNLMATESLDAYEVTLSYKYESLYKGSSKEYTGSIRFIKTAVSEY